MKDLFICVVVVVVTLLVDRKQPIRSLVLFTCCSEKWMRKKDNDASDKIKN